MNRILIYDILPLGFVSVGLNFLPDQGFGFAAKPTEGTTNQATTPNSLFIRTSESISSKTNILYPFLPVQHQKSVQQQSKQQQKFKELNNSDKHIKRASNF